MRRLMLSLSLIAFTIRLSPAQEGGAILPQQWLERSPDIYSEGIPGVKGRPELFKSFLPAIIYMKNGKVIKNISVNLFNEDDLVVSKPYKGYEVQYDIQENDVERFVTISESGDTTTYLRLDKSLFSRSYATSGFYQLMTEDQMLIKKSFKELLKAEKSDGYSQVRTTDEFVLSERYFIRSQAGEKYQNIKLAKKPLSKALGDQATKAKSIMKKNGWKWNNEQHVLLLLKALKAS